MPRRATAPNIDVTQFRTTWLNRFGLDEGNWRSKARRHLESLPFSDARETHPLVEFLFDGLPKLLVKRRDAETLNLAEAFGWACFAFWQCGSAFPAFPENYATYLEAALRQAPGKREPGAITLARLITGVDHSSNAASSDGPGARSAPKAADGQCGFNQLQLKRPDLIRGSERLILEGRYQDYLKAGAKYEEYETALRFSTEFAADWRRLKALRPVQLRGAKHLHRSRMPERNWVQGAGAVFASELESFQALFDVFCWKYYLWGMDGDQPLLMKVSVVFAPLGTQIFIPGYLSFDPKRDLDLKKISSLHRARGIPRQGPGFSIGRLDLAKKRRLAKAADKEARRRGLKGDARYEYICEKIGFLDGGDYRRVRKLLESLT